MHDPADVGLVDAHPERGGGAHDVEVAVHEARLHLLALEALHARVVGRRAHAVRRTASRRARRPGGGWRRRRCPAAGAAAIRSCSARSLRCSPPSPWKRSTESRMFGRSKPRMITSGSRSPSRATISSRTGGAAVAVRASIVGRPSASAAAAEAQVVGPEVVAPLGDAVRLVDHQQRRPGDRQLVQHVGVGELLGGEEEELERLLGELGQRPRALGGGDMGVQLRGAAGDALGEVLDLVALERDQRRDHDRRARGQQPGDLVDRRLARAGRHHDERVAAGEHGLDRLALARAQRVEAECLPRHALDALRGVRHAAEVPRWAGRETRRPIRDASAARAVESAQLGSRAREHHALERPPAALRRHRRRRA